jgi:hypothetical protein
MDFNSLCDLRISWISIYRSTTELRGFQFTARLLTARLQNFVDFNLPRNYRTSWISIYRATTELRGFQFTAQLQNFVDFNLPSEPVYQTYYQFADRRLHYVLA